MDFAIDSINKGGLGAGGAGKRAFFPRGIDFAFSKDRSGKDVRGRKKRKPKRVGDQHKGIPGNG